MGSVFSGTLYDIATYIDPIQRQTQAEAYQFCNYPLQEELDFSHSLAGNASPLDRQRTKYIDARVAACSTTANVFENSALSDAGRSFYIFELLAEGVSGAALFGVDLLAILNRRRPHASQAVAA